MTRSDLVRARRIGNDLHRHGIREALEAYEILEAWGSTTDQALARSIRRHIDRRLIEDRQPIAWAFFFTVALGSAAGLAAWLAWQTLSLIDFGAVLQFIAPTAFDPRSLEVLAAGLRP